MGLGEVKVINTGRWTGDEAGEPVSGEEVVNVRKVKRAYRIRTRLASCFCSACQRSQYEDCHVGRAYPGIVPALREVQVRETVIMDTGVGPVDVSEAEEITFKSRQKTCQMARVTGTQVARERLGGCSHIVRGARKGGRTHTYCPFRIVSCFVKCVLLLVFVVGNCDGCKRVF